MISLVFSNNETYLTSNAYHTSTPNVFLGNSLAAHHGARVVVALVEALLLPLKIDKKCCVAFKVPNSQFLKY